MKNWKAYAFWIGLSEAVGGLSGWLTREGAKRYGETVVQPPLSPPAVVFPIVWGILFLLMGIGAARIYLSPAGVWSMRGIKLFLIQLGFNFLWSIIFFNMQRWGFAFFWLLALLGLIIAMTLNFRRADKTAALLQIPYILWVSFAAYLNLGVWILNM